MHCSFTVLLVVLWTLVHSVPLSLITLAQLPEPVARCTVATLRVVEMVSNLFQMIIRFEMFRSYRADCLILLALRIPAIAQCTHIHFAVLVVLAQSFCSHVLVLGIFQNLR